MKESKRFNKRSRQKRTSNGVECCTLRQEEHTEEKQAVQNERDKE